MKKLSAIITLSLLSFMCIHTASAQDDKQSKEQKIEAAIKEKVESKRYAFIAQTAIPMGMRIRQLTSDYELKVSNDTLEAYLPYFGRAYTATIGSSDDGINFKTTDFTYTSTSRKKGGWNITIVPKKSGDTRQLILSITSTGYASLQVNSNNKQTISFNGYIK
ncbi:MAG: DUF4251 domain-containing protein [Bacteroidetes bacterium]|nr:DUF4251 domain-containing protein [Bacteroidota bacterium]